MRSCLETLPRRRPARCRGGGERRRWARDPSPMTLAILFGYPKAAQVGAGPSLRVPSAHRRSLPHGQLAPNRESSFTSEPRSNSYRPLRFAVSLPVPSEGHELHGCLILLSKLQAEVSRSLRRPSGPFERRFMWFLRQGDHAEISWASFQPEAALAVRSSGSRLISCGLISVIIYRPQRICDGTQNLAP